MLYRYTVRLYDENPLDASILDDLSALDSRQRHDFLRTLIRLGHQALNLESNHGLIEALVKQEVASVLSASPSEARAAHLSDQDSQAPEVMAETKPEASDPMKAFFQQVKKGHANPKDES